LFFCGEGDFFHRLAACLFETRLLFENKEEGKLFEAYKNVVSKNYPTSL
jgi:hypothetical protein